MGKSKKKKRNSQHTTNRNIHGSTASCTNMYGICVERQSSTAAAAGYGSWQTKTSQGQAFSTLPPSAAVSAFFYIPNRQQRGKQGRMLQSRCTGRFALLDLISTPAESWHDMLLVQTSPHPVPARSGNPKPRAYLPTLNHPVCESSSFQVSGRVY